MANSTQYYGLGYFDFGDPLGSDFAGQIEIDRWIFLDKQIYGLMSIFGNGVIEGWIVSSTSSLSLSISEGYGNINFMSGRTTFPAIIANISPNSINYIYARIKERTRFSEDVDFIVSPTRNLDDQNFLLLAEVTSGPISIELIDNSIRQDIGFLRLIQETIRNHKHRGGDNYPSKIDLSTEVKGQLPSYRISDLDAEKITTGSFDLSVIPNINHQDLLNVGLLTHAQLDSLVKSLSSSNRELFGEISTSNLLQIIISLKYIYEDPDSPFYISNKTIDENFINEFAIIPGITPDSLIDFDSTSAEINLTEHFIKGVPPDTGTFFYVNYNTELAWISAYYRDNITTLGNSAILSFDDNSNSNIVTIENFESSTVPGENLSGSGQNLFKKETIVLSDGAAIVSNSSSTNVLEGFYSGKFTHTQTFRSQFVKEFGTAQDWSLYDSFTINIKCFSLIHGAIKLYFEDSSGERSLEYILLNQNEITENSDPSQNDFETRIIDLSTIPFRNDIKKFVIFSDDLINPFEFYIDYINIQKSILLPESGTLLLRFSTSSSVTFSTIDWNSTEPDGTEITVRAKSANGTVFLSRSEFTDYLQNNSNLNLIGTDLEIEIKLYSDLTKTLSPMLNSIRILILTQAEIDGYKIDSVEEFSRGTSENITISTGPSIGITDPIYVNSYYFTSNNRVNQIYGSPSISDPVAIFGNNTPISPNSIFAAIEKNDLRVTTPYLFEPRSVVRKHNRNFIIADTYNDRVLEFSEDGELINGVGSINYQTEKTFPLSASFDSRTGILYIVWSRKIPFSSINTSRITIQTSSNRVQLVRDFDKILGLTTSELTTINAESQILPIYLSAQNASIIQNFTNTTVNINLADDILPTGIDKDSIFYKAISNVLGFPLFVGNFAYIDGIFSPTWADKNDNTFIISNAKIAIKEFSFPTQITETVTKSTNTSSIIEIDENNNVIFASDILDFSPFVPGRAKRIDNTTILIAGLKPGAEAGEPQEGRKLDFRTIDGSKDTRNLQKKTLNDIFFSSESKFVGSVVLYDTVSRSSLFEYLSPEGLLASDVDIDYITGEYIIAESSFEKSGRIIKTDSSGNITFSYGEGLYSIINDIFFQNNGSIVIST